MPKCPCCHRYQQDNGVTVHKPFCELAATEAEMRKLFADELNQEPNEEQRP